MTLSIPSLEPSTHGARAFLSKPRKTLLIDGAWVNATSGRTFPTYDPANGRLLAELAAASEADVDAAVAAARRAFDSDPWRGLTPSARGKLLWRIADLIDAHVDELAELDLLRPVCKGLGKRATLHALDTADHGFRTLKRSRKSQEDVFAEMARVASEWTSTLGPR